jgi:hypothetical protein
MYSHFFTETPFSAVCSLPSLCPLRLRIRLFGKKKPFLILYRPLPVWRLYFGLFYTVMVNFRGEDDNFTWWHVRKRRSARAKSRDQVVVCVAREMVWNLVILTGTYRSGGHLAAATFWSRAKLICRLSAINKLFVSHYFLDQLCAAKKQFCKWRYQSRLTAGLLKYCLHLCLSNYERFYSYICSVVHPFRSRKVIEQRLLITVNYFSFKGTVVIKYNSCTDICFMLVLHIFA